MSKRLKRHETIPNLTADDGIESPHPLGIADPQFFMLSEAIKNTLESSFTGLQSTLTNISTQMERMASRPSSFHAQRADDRSKRLKRHETIPNLTADDGIESPHPLGIADPQFFMLSEAIKNTLESSFTGLQSTLTNISTQMERMASRPSSFHAQRADDRISIRTPSSTHTRVSASRHHAATSADGSPPRHHRADNSADGSPAPSIQYGGGGGDLPDVRGDISQEDEGNASDAISLLPAEDIPVVPPGKQIQSLP